MQYRDIPIANRSEENEAIQNFLQVVYQVNNIACLFGQNDDGSLTAEYVTPSFVTLMECETQEEALELMDGDHLLANTWPEDRPILRDILENHVNADRELDITIRRITRKGNLIWCTIHFAFIDDYKKHYIYATFADITRWKKYEEQLQSVYTSLGESFHQTNDDLLARVRANLTENYVEEANGTSNFIPEGGQRTYSEYLAVRSSYLPIAEERDLFLATFSIGALTKSYMDGVVAVSKVLYSRLPNNAVFYVKITANVTRHPMSGNLVAFITEESNNPEKLATTINGKILARSTGTAVLTADNGIKVNVIVEKSGITGLDGGKNKYKLSMDEGEDYDLEFESLERTVVFKSSKPDIAFIDEFGHIVARKAGKAKFTTKINGKTITVNVVVEKTAE